MLFLKTNCKERGKRGGNEAETRRKRDGNETERNEKEDPFPTGNEPSDIFNSK